MALLRIEIGPGIEERTVSNLDAAEIIQDYLVASGIDIEFMTNQEKLSAFMRLIVRHIWQESIRGKTRVLKESVTAKNWGLD